MTKKPTPEGQAMTDAMLKACQEVLDNAEKRRAYFSKKKGES